MLMQAAGDAIKNAPYLGFGIGTGRKCWYGAASNPRLARRPNFSDHNAVTFPHSRSVQQRPPAKALGASKQRAAPLQPTFKKPEDLSLLLYSPLRPIETMCRLRRLKC